jgi:hypothetical protein
MTTQADLDALEALNVQMVPARLYEPTTVETQCKMYPIVVRSGDIELLKLWAQQARLERE